VNSYNEEKNMKTKTTVFITSVIFVLVLAMQFGFKHALAKTNPVIQKASFYDFPADADTFDFDKSEFKEELKKIKEELKELKTEKIRAYFDSDEFKEEMKNLKTEIKNLKIHDLHFDFDKEQFDKDMKELSEELKNQKFVWKDTDFDIDLSGLKESMEVLKENMKNLKINLDGLSEEMETLNEFIKDLKTELINDELIKNENDDADIELNKNEMKVNGEKVPDELFEKYRNMYKDYFGKEPGECSHFHLK
jgi:chromosome segregation ATPase